MKRARSWKSGVIGVALLAAASAPAAAQQIVVDGNIFFNNTADFATDAAGPSDSPCFFTETALCDTAFTRNLAFTFDGAAANPLLSDPYNQAAPRWVPAATSPALGSNGIVLKVPAGTCLEQVCYRGAVPPAPADDWTTGWTYYSHNGGLGRTDIDTTKTLITLSGTQPSYTMKDTANYLISGKVEFPAGTTLTIDPGVVILGDPSVLSYIVIQRDADIQSLGTRTRPIIMTSGARWQDGLQLRGDWAGLVINGNAKANCAACTTGSSCFSEGDPTLPHCGNNDDDNSGTVRYTRVEYSGHVFSANNELNAFTMNSLGRGTTFEYNQAHLSRDDGFEWFGGTIACKHLVSTGSDDDNFDWQMGYRGCVQFGVCFVYNDTGDKGIEADNNEFNFAAIHKSNPVLSNMTLVGRGPNAGVGSVGGIHLRRGTAATIINSIVIGWKTSGIDVDDSTTFRNGCGAAPALFTCPAVLTGVESSSGARGFASSVSPNPMVDAARIRFSLPVGGRTKLSVYDPAGRIVGTVVDQNLTAGPHEFDWRLPAGAESGVFFYRIASNGHVESGRIVSVR